MIIADKYVLAQDIEEAQQKGDRVFTKLEDAQEVLSNAKLYYPTAFKDYRIFHVQTIITEIGNEN